MSENQNFPRDIVFAPKKLQGFNFQHPFSLQVIKQVQLLFLHLEDNNPTSKLLNAEWEALVQVSGWRDTTNKWPWRIINQYVPITWLGKLFEHAQELRMEIHLPLPGLPPRKTDIPVMELFVNGAVPVGDLRLLNEVRMSKEVVWLLDLVVAHSNRLTASANTNQRVYSETVWPEHAPINGPMLTLWVSSLQKTAIDPCGPHPFSLRRKLSPWNHTSGVWRWCQDSKVLARLDQNHQWAIWKSHSGCSQFKRTFKATSTSRVNFQGTHLTHVQPLPADMLQVDSVIWLGPS